MMMSVLLLMNADADADDTDNDANKNDNGDVHTETITMLSYCTNADMYLRQVAVHASTNRCTYVSLEDSRIYSYMRHL